MSSPSMTNRAFRHRPCRCDHTVAFSSIVSIGVPDRAVEILARLDDDLVIRAGDCRRALAS